MRWSWLIIALMIGIIGYTLYYKHGWSKRVENTAVKIQKWDIDKRGMVYLQIRLVPDQPVYYYREITCKMLDENKQLIKEVSKPIETELVAPTTKIFPIGAAPKNIKYLDCSFR